MRLVSLLAVYAASLSLAGCGDSIPPDPDKTPTMQAPRLPVDFPVEDAIDSAADKVDFKLIQPTTSGKGTVKVDFGEGHTVAGSVAVFGTDGQTTVEETAVTSADSVYTISWDVAQDAVYYLKVASAKGKGKYKVTFNIEVPKAVDPCEGVECEDNEECQAGNCVEVKAAECDPKCKAGLECVNGTCEKPCGGGCPKGQLCSRTKNECYKDPCYQKRCAAGERCVGGTCKAKAVPRKAKECKPACTGTAKCNTKTGTCEGGAEAPPIEVPADPCAGPLNGKIIQVIPQGTKSVLVLNRGSKVCVKVGQSGKIAGVGPAFKVTEVYEFRCKAVIDADEKTIGANRGVTINR